MSLDGRIINRPDLVSDVSRNMHSRTEFHLSMAISRVRSNACPKPLIILLSGVEFVRRLDGELIRARGSQNHRGMVDHRGTGHIACSLFAKCRKHVQKRRLLIDVICDIYNKPIIVNPYLYFINDLTEIL